MHIPDGLISGSLNTVAGLAAIGAVGMSCRRVSRQVETEPQMVPLLATTGAFLFAAQMLNFPIGGGTSGHALGAAVAAALLGPWNACLVMALVVTIQSLGFADGGLTALGTNIVNMAVIGSWSAYLVMRLLRLGLPDGRAGYLLSAGLAGWASLICSSAACAAELAWSGTSPTRLVFPAVLGTHAIIGIGEALITAGVLTAVVTARPDMAPTWARLNVPRSDQGLDGAGSILTAGRLSLLFLLIAVVLAGLASPMASSAPDGLERAIERTGIARDSLVGTETAKTPLRGYQLPGVSDRSVSTGLSGVLGTMSVFVAGFLAIKIIRRRRLKRES